MRVRTPAWVEATQRAMSFQTRFRAGHSLGDKPHFTLLIDHSGSMKGARSLAAATVTDILGDMLEHQHCSMDLLGFTTGAWKGGKSRVFWLGRGAPENPGRLNDLLHIVYNDETGSVGRWPVYLPLMLMPNVLRENIDGEALLWARDRAMRRDPTSWVCLLISDGAPVDDSTLQENDLGYLQRHLQLVVEQLNADPRTRLGCLAFDYHAVVPFRAIKHADGLEHATLRAFDLLEDLIWPQATES